MKRLIDWIDNDDIDKLVIVLVVIAGISSILVPAVLVIFAQELFMYDPGAFLFEHPSAAYLIVGAGFLIVTAAGILYFAFKSLWDRHHPLFGGAVTLFLMVFSLPVAYVGLMHYFYMDDDQFVYNDVWTLEERAYAWEDIDVVELLTEEEGGSRSYDGLKIHTNEGTVYELSMGGGVTQQRSRILEAVEAAGGTVTRS
ncbi:hypothetical protein [Alkalicoccus chagannorensis]|uniref:hypothetical protein n=1 Tax=Alkalicoccus chagannorensis TaxID=427072 RepID=UPI00047B8CEE|nr:hypothetical protein [Alkalicoccus chagannorensis]